MTTEELVAKIDANPCLLPEYRGEEYVICPYCVRSDVTHPDQDKVEKTLDTIIRCSTRHDELESKILEMTRDFKKELSHVTKEWQQAVHELYEMRNSKR